ncbi:hypothetical protein [uncultured Tateyamaria sp.]|uniref:hypothetical protein n=1 Tax=uncultured Tateyamaria sp. TaxID=455651 RepID=UPI002607D6AA|nr:hypothetical protein [uncultured Tateyamaria sp.]
MIAASINLEEDIRTKFAPVILLKSASRNVDAGARLLTKAEKRETWDVLIEALPAILGQCDNFGPHPDDGSACSPLVLWDFMNGREIRIDVNKRGGYDLEVLREQTSWSETQLPLDLLLLKLLALDYVPEQFRGFVG